MRYNTPTGQIWIGEDGLLVSFADGGQLNIAERHRKQALPADILIGLTQRPSPALLAAVA
jgi:hypothetical protein